MGKVRGARTWAKQEGSEDTVCEYEACRICRDSVEGQHLVWNKPYGTVEILRSIPEVRHPGLGKLSEQNKVS